MVGMIKLANPSKQSANCIVYHDTVLEVNKVLVANKVLEVDAMLEANTMLEVNTGWCREGIFGPRAALSGVGREEG